MPDAPPGPELPAWLEPVQYALAAAGLLLWAVYWLARRSGREPLGSRPEGEFPDTTPALYVAGLLYIVALGLQFGAFPVAYHLLGLESRVWPLLAHTLVNAAFGYALLPYARRGLRRPVTGVGQQVAVGLAGGLVTYGVVAVVGQAMAAVYEAVDVVKPVQDVVELSQLTTGWQAVVAGLATVALAPFAEEVFFRGIVYPAALQVATVRGALLAQAAVFGVMHVAYGPATHYPLAIPLAAVGLCAGWLYHRTASLLACITLHAVFNAIQLAFIHLSAGG